MAAPKMTRHDMKQDDLVTVIEKMGGLFQKNPILVRNVGLASLGVLGLAAVVYLFLSSRASTTVQLLNEAQIRFSAPVVESGARPSDPLPTYGSAAERDQAALESFEKLVQQYGGSKPGRIARYYQGILLARLGRNEEAETVLKKFIDSSPSPLLAALARAQLAQVLTRHGNLEEAAKIYAELAKSQESAYPRDWALFYLAETLSRQGKKQEAVSTYQQILKEYPTSYFAAQAGQRVKGA